MSLLSHERVVISFSPQQLHAVQLKGRYRPLLQEKCARPLLPADEGDWSAGIDALEILLEDPGWGGRDTTLVLSSHYVRYAVLPKGEKLGETEQMDLGRLIFRNTFGELAQDWELRVSRTGNSPSLASGVPRELLVKLREICAGRGYLRSIQPSLMVIFNRGRHLIGHDRGVLALIESGRITLACLQNGHWQSVLSRAGAGADLPDFLDENTCMAGQLADQPPENMLWLCDLTGQARLPETPPWQLQRLTSGATNGAAPSLADWFVP